MKNLLIIKMLLVLFISFASCSSNSQNIKKDKSVIQGEYVALIKNKKNIDEIKKEFKPYGIVEFRFVTKDVLKISLEKDPGLEEIKKIKVKFKQIEILEPNRILKVQDK